MAEVAEQIAQQNGNSPQRDSDQDDTISPLKDDYKRKTKRNSPPPGEKSPRAVLTYGSNKVKQTDKHSRTGKGRGLPKKGKILEKVMMMTQVKHFPQGRCVSSLINGSLSSRLDI